MEFIIADEKREDIGFVDKTASLDIDIGSTDDFTLSVDLSLYNAEKYRAGNFIYSIGTEYGGVLDDPETSTSANSLMFTGDTFRGRLKKKYIEPDKNSAYRIVNGEVHSVMSMLVKEQFESLYKVSSVSTNVRVNNYQFNRYCSLYDGLIAMLASVGCRLHIESKYENDRMIIELSAVPITDYSDDIEFSQNSNLKFKIKKCTNVYNYMLALGRGELTEREVIYLKNDNGVITQVSSIPKGDSVKVYLYDNSSAEELLKESISKFKGINTDDTYSMTIRENLDLDIGDIVGGRDYITGTVIAQPITKKIIKINNNGQSISYEIGGST